MNFPSSLSRGTRALASALVVFLICSNATAADAAAVTAPPSIGFSVLRMIGALCLVLSLLFAGVWAYRNSGRLSRGGARDAKLKILETRSLGHRHSIFVVAYEQQRLLLSTSPTGVGMLTHLPEARLDEVDPMPTPAAVPNFSSAFLQALTTLRK